MDVSWSHGEMGTNKNDFAAISNNSFIFIHFHSKKPDANKDLKTNHSWFLQVDGENCFSCFVFMSLGIIWVWSKLFLEKSIQV